MTAEELHIQFQGGFVGKECHLEVKPSEDEAFTKVADFYPEDKNSLQVSFQVKCRCNSETYLLAKEIPRNIPDLTNLFSPPSWNALIKKI